MNIYTSSQINKSKDRPRPSIGSRIHYRLYGPTTLHLQHELGLLITLIFLTTASLMGLYRTTFGTKGDYAYLILSTIWLSRHGVFRFIATTDVYYCTTMSYPFHILDNIRGFLLRFFLLAAYPGHYFDTTLIHGSNSSYFKSWGLVHVLDMVMTGNNNSSFATTNHHHPKNKGSPNYRWNHMRNIIIIPIALLVTGLRWIYRYMEKAIGLDLLSQYTSSNHRHHHRSTTDSIFSDNNMTLPPPHHSNNKRQHQRRTSFEPSSSNKNIKSNHHPNNSLNSDFFSSFDVNHSTNSSTLNTTTSNGTNGSTAPASIFHRLYQPTFHEVSLILDRVMERIPSASVCLLLACILYMFLFFIYILPMGDEYLSGSKHLYYGLSLPWDGTLNDFHKRVFSPPKTTRNPTPSQHDKSAQRQIIDYVTRVSLYERLEKLQYDYKVLSISSSYFSTLQLQWSSIAVMMTMIACVGIIISILLFGSILPPLPDLILSQYYDGNNILIRTGQVHLNMKSTKSSTKQTMDKGSACIDSYKNLSCMNNYLLMHFKIILLRILENTFVCAILPHSRYVCKYTGHCYKDPMIWEVDGSMGITGIQGKDMFSSINYDYFTFALILCTVGFVTTLILIGQMLTLDRGRLVMYAFQHLNAITSGDNVAQGSRKGHNNSGQKGINITDDWYTPQSTVSKRGFFAEMIKVMQSLIEWFWKRVQYILTEETGHISSSRVIAIFSQLHALYAIFLIIICSMQLFSGRTSFSIMLVFIAIFNSAGCLDIGLHNINELNDLAEEITM